MDGHVDATFRQPLVAVEPAKQVDGYSTAAGSPFKQPATRRKPASRLPGGALALADVAMADLALERAVDDKNVSFRLAQGHVLDPATKADVDQDQSAGGRRIRPVDGQVFDPHPVLSAWYGDFVTSTR